jgi:hypothetical protein
VVAIYPRPRLQSQSSGKCSLVPRCYEVTARFNIQRFFRRRHQMTEISRALKVACAGGLFVSFVGIMTNTASAGPSAENARLCMRLAGIGAHERRSPSLLQGLHGKGRQYPRARTNSAQIVTPGDQSPEVTWSPLSTVLKAARTLSRPEMSGPSSWMRIDLFTPGSGERSRTSRFCPKYSTERTSEADRVPP